MRSFITAPLALVALTMCMAYSPVFVQAEDQPKVDPSRLAAGVKDILRTRCYECHGQSSKQLDIDVLDWNSLIKNKTVIPQQPDASPLYQAIINADEDVRMPQDLPALSAAEIELVRQWIVAKAPEFPTDVVQPKETAKDAEFRSVAGVDYVLKQIHQHQRTLTADKRRYVRYFSCNHLLMAGVTRETLNLQRQAFAKAINHLSREPQIVVPEVINGETATLFAVDIRKLGWHTPALKESGKSATEAGSLNLHDLVLLEYPYAIVYEDSATYDALVTEYVVPSAMVRPIPFVRSDWFCSVATLPPLYHDLLQLPRDLTSLEKDLEVDTADNLQHRRAHRAGMAVSGVSRNNRAVERHPYRHGAYWKSVDYASSKGQENIFTDPVNLHGTGGEMIFNLANGLQAYYVADSKGDRLSDAPTSIVTDKFSEDKTVRNGLSCIRCHDRGIKEFRDDVRPAVEKLSGSGHITKREVLALYPPAEEMTRLVQQDRDRFLMAMKNVLGDAQETEPLIPVTQRFIDTPLQLAAVTGELGLQDTDELKTVFKQPQFTGFGLVALTQNGVVRRDMWEDYFDQVVRSLGLGVPVVPLDGNSRPDYQPQGNQLDVHVSTSKKNNVFAPGDQLSVLVENRGKSALFIELIGTGTKGEKVTLVPAGAKVEAGATFRFPESGTLTVQPSLGKELVTLFASETLFPAGQIYRGKHIDDRVVHRVYHLDTQRGEVKAQQDASKILKRTIEIETR